MVQHSGVECGSGTGKGREFMSRDLPGARRPDRGRSVRCQRDRSATFSARICVQTQFERVESRVCVRAEQFGRAVGSRVSAVGSAGHHARESVTARSLVGKSSERGRSGWR
jgi:hypothetical protein